MRGLPAWVLALSILTYFVVEVGAAAVYSVITWRRSTLDYPPPPPAVPSPISTAPVKPGNLYEVTAYSFGCIMPRFGPEPKHPTRAADGSWPRAHETIAADWKIHPRGSEVLIEGLGYRVVTDRGRAIVGHRLDLFLPSCKDAREWGRQKRRVWKVPATATAWSE